MKIVAPILLLFALVLTMSSVVDMCTDGNECCDSTCADCFVCSCGGTISVVLEESSISHPDLTPIDRILVGSSMNTFAGYTLLPDLPPRSLA